MAFDGMVEYMSGSVEVLPARYGCWKEMLAVDEAVGKGYSNCEEASETVERGRSTPSFDPRDDVSPPDPPSETFRLRGRPATDRRSPGEGNRDVLFARGVSPGERCRGSRIGA
jgi:hypothetical protein